MTIAMADLLNIQFKVLSSSIIIVACLLVVAYKENVLFSIDVQSKADIS